MHDFDVFNECVTNQPTDQPTDTAYYRDARTHLKREKDLKGCNAVVVREGKKLGRLCQ